MTPPPRPAPSASSEASPAGPDDDLIGNAGPAFEADELDGLERPAPPPEELDTPSWGSDQVRSLLETQGRVTHHLIGVSDQDWQYTEQDLKAIAPPLTRILNRYDATRAAAAAGDEALVAIGFGGYAMRSYLERRAAMAAAAAQAAAPAPVTGVAPDPPSDFGPSPFGTGEAS